MMYFVCYVLLLTSFGGVTSTKVSVEGGKSIILFQNVDNPDKEITLYVNGKTDYTNIVTWTIENTTIKPYWRENYTNFQKISMDSDRNIWIDNFDESYVRKYCIPNYHHNDSACCELELDIQQSGISWTTIILASLYVVLGVIFNIWLHYEDTKKLEKKVKMFKNWLARNPDIIESFCAEIMPLRWFTDIRTVLFNGFMRYGISSSFPVARKAGRRSFTDQDIFETECTDSWIDHSQVPPQWPGKLEEDPSLIKSSAEETDNLLWPMDITTSSD